MCGIAGVIGPGTGDDARPLLDSPLRTLRHRGPDDHGWLLDTPQGLQIGRGELPSGPIRGLLLHRRLSILDLSDSGRQPMTTPDGAFAIAFNGEIYNYVELREELRREGCVFHSQSDTEVLLHACARWGPAALRRLVGMFAFALLDTRRRTLFLARDCFGIKPLYYVRAGATFAFASEIKALLRLPFVRRHVNAQRFFEYLRFGRTDHGGETLFADIRQLPPAHYLEVPLDDARPGAPVRYWDLELQERIDLSFDEAARRLRDLFLDNVRLHMRSDVPVGAALSGGIDSSAIVSCMRAVEPSADLHTFSYIADDPAVSEETWVDLVGRHTGAAVHKTHAAPDELVADLDELIHTQDEPFGSTSIYAQYRVFRLAREKGVTVMLDGQGADELLAGYRPYLAARLGTLVRKGHWVAAYRFAKRAAKLPGTRGLLRLLLQTGKVLVPSGCRSLVHRLLGPGLTPEWMNGSWFRARGVTAPWVPTTGIDRPNLLREQLRETVVATSLPMLLRYEDRNSMAASIESRVPFLTPALAEFVLRLPEEYLIAADGTSKHVFRQAMRGLVPDAVLDRRDKIGFATPELRWLKALRPWVEATLASQRARAIPALNLPAMRREWRCVVEGRRPFDFRVWRWVNLIRWAERFDVSFP
jgi:asparagine synthase (glutamine-hydrolysing)